MSKNELVTCFQNTIEMSKVGTLGRKTIGSLWTGC